MTKPSPSARVTASTRRKIRPRMPPFHASHTARKIVRGMNQALPANCGMIASNSGLLSFRLMKRKSAVSSDWSQDIAAECGGGREVMPRKKAPRSKHQAPEKSQAPRRTQDSGLPSASFHVVHHWDL